MLRSHFPPGLGATPRISPRRAIVASPEAAARASGQALMIVPHLQSRARAIFKKNVRNLFFKKFLMEIVVNLYEIHGIYTSISSAGSQTFPPLLCTTYILRTSIRIEYV